MKYALLIAIKEPSNDTRRPWELFSSHIKSNTEELAGLTVYNEGTLLFDLSVGLNGLCFVLTYLKTAKIRSQVLMFDSEPSWIIS